MKNQGRNLDVPLTLAALVLTILGWVVSLTAGFARSISSGQGPLSREFLVQVALGVLCLPLFLGISMIRAQTWRKLMPVMFFLAFLGLVAVKLFGTEMSGAKRWITLGPITVQPAEMMKVGAILFLAVLLADRQPWKPKKLRRNADWAEKLDKIAIPKLSRFIPAFVLLAVIVMIEREPDLGTAAVVGAVGFLMYLRAGVTMKSVAVVSLIAGLGVYGMIHQEPYRVERLTSHFHRWDEDNIDDIGYQTTQSETAMASGGLVGVGLGAGRAKHMMPAATTDFAMATVAEETGLLGVFIVLGLTALLVYRLYLLSLDAPTSYARLLCFGVASWITVQASVNLMMANGFLPPIGIPFPFISSGGTSLIALWAAIGLCQSSLCEQTVKEEAVETRRNGWRNRRARLSRA